MTFSRVSELGIVSDERCYLPKLSRKGVLKFFKRLKFFSDEIFFPVLQRC